MAASDLLKDPIFRVKLFGLVEDFLDEYADRLGSDGCNDWDFPDSWSESEKERFVQAYHEYNGDPEEFDPRRLSLGNHMVASLLSYLFENFPAAETRTDDAIAAVRDISMKMDAFLKHQGLGVPTVPSSDQALVEARAQIGELQAFIRETGGKPCAAEEHAQFRQLRDLVLKMRNKIEELTATPGLNLRDIREAGWILDAHTEKAIDGGRYFVWVFHQEEDPSEVVVATGNDEFEALEDARQKILEYGDVEEEFDDDDD